MTAEPDQGGSQRKSLEAVKGEKQVDPLVAIIEQTDWQCPGYRNGREHTGYILSLLHTF